MKRSMFRLILAILVFVLLGNDANAYKGDTHRNITNNAISYLILIKSIPDTFAYTNLITNGSVEEDKPLTNCMNHFSPRLTGVLNGKDAIEWALNDSGNDYNWPVATDKDNIGKEKGWTALGHVVHLLEDMAVAAHTRKDKHPSREPIEEIAEQRTPSLPPVGNLKTIGSLEEFYKELRDSTQKNYFSNDTCFRPNFPGPKEDTGMSDANNNYFVDENNTKIAQKTYAYRLTGIKKYCHIDNVIAEEQFDKIGPVATLYAASLIKYYCEQPGVNLKGKPEGQITSQVVQKGKVITPQRVTSLTASKRVLSQTANALKIGDIPLALRDFRPDDKRRSILLGLDYAQRNELAQVLENAKLELATSNMCFYKYSWTDKTGENFVTINMAKDSEGRWIITSW